MTREHLVSFDEKDGKITIFRCDSSPKVMLAEFVVKDFKRADFELSLEAIAKPLGEIIVLDNPDVVNLIEGQNNSS